MLSPDKCPGCGGTAPILVDSLATSALIGGYDKSGLARAIGRLFDDLNGQLTLWSCRQCSLRWYADAPAGDAAFYESLQQHDWYYQADKPEYGFARRWIPSEAQVLEVGCGRGAFAGFIPSVNYRGLEFNQLAVQKARDAGLQVEVKPVGQEATDRPAHYDVVCHFQVLEHVEAPLSFMAECAQALKPGGLMIVAVPAEDSFLGLAESSWLNMPPHHLTRWTDQSLDSMLRRVGMEPLELWHEEVASYHKDWHRSVVTMAGWRSLLGQRPGMIGSRYVNRLLREACRVPGIANSLYARGMTRHPQAARGHTVCIVGRKQ